MMLPFPVRRSLARVRPVLLAALLAMAGTSAAHADDETVLRSYLTGNGLLNRGMYDLAADEYRAFIAAHPRHNKVNAARYGLGVCLHRLGDVDGAVDALLPLRSNRRFEFSAEAVVILGQCYLRRGQFDEATACFADAARHHADHELADDATALRAEALYRAKAYGKVGAPVDELVSRWPDSPLRDRAELFAGLALMNLGQHAQAIERFDGFNERFPKSPYADQVHLLLAQSHHRTGALPKAAAGYRRVIDSGTASLVPDGLYGMAVVLREGGKPADAEKLLDDLLDRFATSRVAANARLERGRAAFDRGRYDAAMAHFKALATHATLADQALYWMAKCDLRKGRDGDAAQRLETTIKRFPRSPVLAEMHYDLAVVLVRAGNDVQATEVLATFHERFPDHRLAAEAAHLHASAEHGRGRFAESLVLCDAFLDRHSRHPLAGEVAFLRAENLVQQGKTDKGIDAFAAYLDQHGDHARAEQASFRLGAALHAAGRFDEAQPHLQRVVDGRDTDPAFLPALAALGDIAFERNDWTKARRLLTEYVALADPGPLAEGALLKQGLAAQRGEHYEEALAAYDALLATYRDGAHRDQAIFERGQALLALDRLDEADEAFAIVAAADDDDLRGHALFHRGTIAQRQERHADAARFLDEASASGSAVDGVESLYQAARAHLAAGRFEEAATRFGAIVDDHGDHARSTVARANRAIALARLDQHAAALAEMDALGKARRPVPAELSSTLAYEKAWCLRALDRDDEAAAAYRSLIGGTHQGPLASHARLELAELETDAGRLEEAIEQLRVLNEALEANEDSLPADVARECVYRLAVCEYESGNDDQAAALFAQFIEAHPDSPLAADAALCCGEALYRTGRHGKAAARFRAVLDDHAGTEAARPALLRLGECESVLQKWARSERHFADYLDRYPEDKMWFQAQFGLGWARENQRRYDDAISAYRLVVDKHRGPTAARAQFQIGECLFAQKKHEEAARELLKVDILYAYPEWSAAALYEAGRCFEALARSDEARRHYEQVTRDHDGSRWAQLAAARLTALTGGPLPGRGRGE